MSHTLTLDVPDEVFAELESGAASLGVDVADYCLRRLRNGTTVEDDPFWQVAGSIEGDSPVDLADRHDFYLAEEAMNTHADEK